MMWSGDPQYSQWALNPSTYQNIAHEEVDWAALAQQWIQMKETHPSDQIPPAPPPPPIGDKSDSGDKKKDSELEGGEAPMDMDTKEDNSNSSNTQSGDANSWNSWPNWQQWGWNWSATGGMVPPGGVPPPNQSLGQDKGSTSTSTMGVPPYSYPHNSQAYTSGTGVYDYNHAGGSDHYSQYKDGRDMEHSQHVKRGSEVMASGYWTSGGSADTGGVPPGPGGGPSPFIRHNRHDWRRNNRSHDRLRTSEKSDDEEDTTTVLDAAKRRQLPAWIREGLEKMEREKQKKIDRERQIKEREAYLQKKREEEENAMNELEKNAGQPMIPKKSKFESDSEESARGDSPTPSQSSLKRKSRFRNADSPNSSPRHPTARFPSTEPEPVKSREELMQEVMLKVRRTLTEILLEVTTEEMETVAHEVLSRAKAKAPAMQLRKTQALASLTGKLGLGMYGDSEDSDSGDDGPRDNSPGRVNGADSDEELRDVIQRRKMDFIKTEREIEARIQEEEEREKERERRMMGEESDESDGEERQVEKQTDTKHLVRKGSEEEEDDDKKMKILHLQDNIKHEDKLQNSAVRDQFMTPSMRKFSRESEVKLERADRKSPSLHQKKGSVSSEENDDSSSKSNSDSSSSSDSSSTSRSSSSTSRRSSKKSSKSSRSVGGSRRSEKKKSSDSLRKHSRSLSRDSEDFKKSDKHRDRKRESDKDRRGRDKRSRSRSRSDTSRSRDGHERRKSGRRELDSGSRKSRDSDRRSSNSSSKPRAYRHDRESPSPNRKSKKLSRDKRRSRHSSGSSSPSSKRRDSHRGEKRGRYSRSRSSSISPSKKSRRRRRSSSSSRSTQSFERSMGKKSGHSRND